MMIEYRDIQFKDLYKMISSSMKNMVHHILGELYTYKLEFNWRNTVRNWMIFISISWFRRNHVLQFDQIIQIITFSHIKMIGLMIYMENIKYHSYMNQYYYLFIIYKSYWMYEMIHEYGEYKDHKHIILILLQSLHEYNQWNSIQMIIMISCELSAFTIIHSIMIIIS